MKFLRLHDFNNDFSAVALTSRNWDVLHPEANDIFKEMFELMTPAVIATLSGTQE